jgi:citrate lyase subunit beta/citryl-CoA lyase
VTASDAPRALRSFLFAPGNHARRVAKAVELDADVVILDLEDAVAVTEKAAARASVIAALQRPRRSLVYVRVNGVDSIWCQDDIRAVIGQRLDGIVLPKAESAAALQQVDRWITAAESAAGLPVSSLDLMPIVETARGVESALEIAGACARVRRLAFGGGDYTQDLDLVWTEDEHELAYARAKLSHASRLAGIEAPIDTVVLQVRDTERFVRSARTGRSMGFQGKLCIHPDQIAACNTVFSPSPDEVAHAQRVLAAFELAAAQGLASIQVDGLFVDYPIANKARRVLARAAVATSSQYRGH